MVDIKLPPVLADLGQLGDILGRTVLRLEADETGAARILRNVDGNDVARFTFLCEALGWKISDIQSDAQNIDYKEITASDARIDLSRSTRWSAAFFNDVMANYGIKPASDLHLGLSMMAARASSRWRARHENADPKHPDGPRQISILDHRRPYERFFALDEYEVSFERFDGSMSPNAERAVFLAADAVLVLPYDPVCDCVLLVEQFRVGPFARGDKIPWQFEPVAGRIDAGETPEQAARREAKEEADLSLSALHDVAHAYATPGCSTEFYDIYVGIADLSAHHGTVAGMECEDEDIRSHVISFADLMEMADTHRLRNAPLVLAALWLARHRDRLRHDPVTPPRTA